MTLNGITTHNVGPGTADLVANYNGSSFAPNPDSGTGCQFSAILLSDSQAMIVNPGASFGFVDAIGKDVAVDVYVLLDPSPCAVSVTLTLEPVPGMGTGSAKFDVNNSTSLTVTQSGYVKIKGVTPSSVLDNMRIRASANGMNIATETFTVVQVVISIRTGGSSVVSMDNSARGYYNSELGTFNLNTFKSSGAAPAKIWRTGVELVATVTPSSFTGLIIHKRQVVAFKRFDGSNALQASGGPFPDSTFYSGLRDDDPQSNEAVPELVGLISFRRPEPKTADEAARDDLRVMTDFVWYPAMGALAEIGVPSAEALSQVILEDDGRTLATSRALSVLYQVFRYRPAEGVDFLTGLAAKVRMPDTAELITTKADDLRKLMTE